MNAGITELCFCWLFRMLYNFALFKSVNGLEMESLTAIIHNKAAGYSEASIQRNIFLKPSNSEIYEKEPRYNETSI